MSVARLVHVTGHALIRHSERWPGPEDREQRRFLIAVEVANALSDGRYSSREPSFCGNGQRKTGKRGSERDRTIRWCWSVDERRVYLVDKRSRVDVVVTAIRPGEADDRDTIGANGRI